MALEPDPKAYVLAKRRVPQAEFRSWWLDCSNRDAGGEAQ